MSWQDNDPIDLHSGAKAEPIPATLLLETKNTKRFGINKDTKFLSPTNTNPTDFGITHRKVSQGRGTSNSRGGEGSWSGIGATNKTPITAGLSLSINKPQAKKEIPQLELDMFGCVVQLNKQTERPGQLNVTSKTTTNYSNFQQNTHSNNVSPNPPASLSKVLQSLQPIKSGVGQSTDIDFLTNRSRATATTVGVTSKGNTQNKGAGRHTTQSYEDNRLAQQVKEKEELPLRPRSRENNNQFPASSTLPRHAFKTSYKEPTTTLTNNTNNNSNNYNNNTARTTRGSARKSPNNEVIDLVGDSDAEEVTAVVPVHQQHQQLDNEIFRLYGSLPNFTDQQKRNAFSKTEERLSVEHIYLGIYRFDSSSSNSNSTGRKLYLRVDGGNNQCILLGLNTDMDKAAKSDPDGVLSAAPIEIEEIPFAQIKKIICGPITPTSEKAFLTLSVTTALSLNCVNVGPNCMLCPTLHQNTEDSAKFVLIMLSKATLEKFVRQMRNVPFVAKKRNRDEWLAYRNDWSSTTIKDCLFAHHNRKEHTIEELRERAELEVQNKAKAQRRRNRSSAINGSSGNGTSVDPEDCLTHAMYPIEPEVLDAITIFKGDLKKLAPEEYLNDNLIDLKIKHLAATQLEPAQAAAIHVFNCMFYTCLTTPNKPEQGHKVVSRWTNKVDLFSKDYIIIPINYSYHWSLAVIIRPGAVKSSLAQLQADVANWQTWASHSNNNSAKKGSTGSAKKKKSDNATSPTDEPRAEMVQDLTLSNSNTQNSTAIAPEASENVSVEEDVAEGGDNNGVGKDDETEEEGDDSGTESMDIAAEGTVTTATATATATSTATTTPSKLKSDDALRALNSIIHSSARNTPTTATTVTTPTTNNDNISKEESTMNRACIIHMDSLGMHSTPAVGRALRNYLRFEWEARKKAELDAELDALLKIDGNNDRMGAEEIEKMKKSLEKERLKVFNNIDVVKIKVPVQANGYDCGLFVTKFAELVLRTQPSSTDIDIENKFGNILRSDAFSQVDVDGERQNMRDMIEGIRKNWLDRRAELQQQHQSEKAIVAASAQLATTSSSGSSSSSESDPVAHPAETTEMGVLTPDGLADSSSSSSSDNEMQEDDKEEKEDDGEEDLGVAEAVFEGSGPTPAPRVMTNYRPGAKHRAVVHDPFPDERASDTQLDSLLSEGASSLSSPPFSGSASSNSGSGLDTQDSDVYMECSEGTLAVDPTAITTSATATATPDEHTKGDKKDKRDKKRKRSEKDREDVALTEPASAAAASHIASPILATGSSLSRTSSVNVAVAISADGAIPEAIAGAFTYNELPTSKRNKLKKSRQDTEVTDIAVSAGSPAAPVTKKSSIVPVDMKALGGSEFPAVQANGGGAHAFNDSGNREEEEEKDVGEDVGEPVQTPAMATTDRLNHLSLEKTRYSGKANASASGERNVAVRMNTDILDTVPVDTTVFPGPKRTSLHNTLKTYGKK